MHIVTGASALQLLRAIRLGRTLANLPEPTIFPIQVSLAGVTHSRADSSAFLGPRPTTTDRAPSPSPLYKPQQTLLDADFNFKSVRANGYLDLTAFGDAGVFDKDAPLELGVFNPNRRNRCNSRLRTCVLPKDLPASGLIRINRELCFASPALVCVQLSRTLDPVELAQVITELCGSYSVKPAQLADFTPTERPRPVLSLSALERFARQARNVRGSRPVLRQAIALARERSASPAETALSLILSLPLSQGGYDLGLPELNAELVVPDEQLGRVAGTRYELDLFYQSCLLDLEVESTTYHLDPRAAMQLMLAREYRQPEGDQDQQPSANPASQALVAWHQRMISKADDDRRRMRDLQALGVEVIPVTSFDLRSTDRMDQVAWAIAARYERICGRSLAPRIDEATSISCRSARQLLLDRLRRPPLQ